MTTTLKLRKIGNSYGVLLPKEMVARLGVEEGGDISVTETVNGYEFSAYDGDLEDALQWIERGARKYKNTLRALSK